LKNRIGGSLIPVLVNSLLSGNGFDEFSERGGKDVPPKLDVALERDRLILGEGIDSADARIEAVGESEVNDPINGSKGNSGFGSIPSEGIEPFPSATC
jgi:hypothetical protein